jgi:hypothetical protein
VQDEFGSSDFDVVAVDDGEILREDEFDGLLPLFRIENVRNDDDLLAGMCLRRCVLSSAGK